MAYKNIIVKEKDGVAKITINRPEALNALNIDTIKELTKAIEDLGNKKSIKVAILTGNGKAILSTESGSKAGRR